MLGSIILEVILVCLLILIGDFDEIAWQAIGSIGIIFGYSIPCLFYSKIYDNDKYKAIAVIGSYIAFFAALISVLNLWGPLIEGDFELIATFNVVIWMLAFISWILSLSSVNEILKLFKKINVILLTILSFFIIVDIWSANFPEGFLARLYYVLIVLTIGSLICLLILTKVYKKEIVTSEYDKQKSDSNNDKPLQSTVLQEEKTEITDNSK